MQARDAADEKMTSRSQAAPASITPARDRDGIPGFPARLVESCIYELRGIRVMLDRDLARLYGVETRVLNQAVKRNLARFPPDFMFPLTREEVKRMSQIVISPDLTHGADLKFSKNVLAFTEQGVAMLSGVLRSSRAVAVNVEIMRAFVRLRRILADTEGLAERLDELEKKYDVQFRVVFDAIRQLMQKPKPEPEKPRKIGFHVRDALAKYEPGAGPVDEVPKPSPKRRHKP